MSKERKASRKSKAPSTNTKSRNKIHKGSLQSSQWWGILIVLFITFMVFSPSLSNGFVNWDDDVNLLENENVRGLDAYHLKKIFTSDVIGNYNPLPILTFAIEHAIVGFEPFLYHLNNILLHLLVVFLVFRLGIILGLETTAALLLAALFGIHPMRVESVAWVTERKDVLFATFFFAALIQYVSYSEDKSQKKKLIWIYLFFILSLLSKIQAVALPLSMLAIDYWRDRKLSWHLIWEKIPYFALSLFFGLLGIYMLAQNQSLDQSKADYSIAERLVIGSYSYAVYWYKLLIPYPLSPLYPYPKKLPLIAYLSLIPTLCIIGLMVWGYLKQWKAWVFGSVFFTFNIVFLLQILGAGQGFLADRFTYVAYFGLFFSIAWYAQQYLFKVPSRQTVTMGAFGALLLVYGIMSFNQNKIWENGGTLWTHVLKYHSNVDTPFRNRGNFYRDNGQHDKAYADYQALIKIDSTNGPVYNSMAKMFFEQQNWTEALKYYNKAVQFAPEKGEFWINRAATKASMGNMQAALEDANQGLEREPNHANGYQTRFLIKQYLGDFAGSIKDIDQLIQFQPRDAGLRYEKGRAYLIIGQADKGIQFISEAIQMDPSNGLFYLERGKAYLAAGNKQGASADFNQARQRGTQVPQDLINATQ